MSVKISYLNHNLTLWESASPAVVCPQGALSFRCACVRWRSCEPRMGVRCKVFWALVATAWTSFAQRLFRRRSRQLGLWMCQEGVNPCNVILKPELSPAAASTSKTKVTRFQPHPLAIINIQVGHAPAAISPLTALATLWHGALTLRESLWLSRHRQAPRRHVHVGED